MENHYRHALEEIVLELQRKDTKAEFDLKTAQCAEAYQLAQVKKTKVRYDTIHNIYNYVNALYENAIANEQIQTLDGH